MKLRKMITVSAAALMLAGVGASATSVGAPVHASRRTVRIGRNLNFRKYRLKRQDFKLNRQLKSNHFQLKQINREIARLSHKNLRRGKRSKKTVKRHRHAKKGAKKHDKTITRRHAKRSRKSPKSTANQQAKVMTRRVHVGVNNNVYTVEVESNGKAAKMIPGTQKYVSSMKDYAKKYTKPFLANRNAMQTNLMAFKKTHNMRNYAAAAKAYQNLNRIGVTPLNANNQSAQK